MLFAEVNIPHFRATETQKETVTSLAVSIHPALSQVTFTQKYDDKNSGLDRRDWKESAEVLHI